MKDTLVVFIDEISTALCTRVFDGQEFLVKIPPWGKLLQFSCFGVSCYNFHGASCYIVTVINGVYKISLKYGWIVVSD